MRELEFKPSGPLRLALVSQQENQILQDVSSKSSGPEIPPRFEGVNKPLDLTIVEVQMRSDTPFEERVCGHTESRVYTHEGSIITKFIKGKLRWCLILRDYISGALLLS